MLFLVELDHVKTTAPLTPEAGRTFVEQIIFPTIARAEQLIGEKKIIAGGAVVGRVSLRFIVEAESTADVDAMVSSFPLWPVAETRVTPLLPVAERREHVRRLIERLTGQEQRNDR